MGEDAKASPAFVRRVVVTIFPKLNGTVCEQWTQPHMKALSLRCGAHPS